MTYEAMDHLSLDLDGLTARMQNWIGKHYAPDRDEVTQIARLLTRNSGIVVTTRSIILLQQHTFGVDAQPLPISRLVRIELKKHRIALDEFRVYYRADDHTTCRWAFPYVARNRESIHEVAPVLEGLLNQAGGAKPTCMGAEAAPKSQAAGQYCIECGEPAKRNAKFCFRCGTKLTTAKEST